MIKRMIICLITVLIAVVLLNVYYAGKMKDIMLPKASHNNTIAQAPIFEYWDDSNSLGYTPTPWCDELDGAFYTCRIKPHQTMDIAIRIGSGEYLESCEAAAKAHQLWVVECRKRCELDYGPDTNLNISDRQLVEDFRYSCIVECYKIVTLPECDDAFYVYDSNVVQWD